MAKTLPPGIISIPGIATPFVANAVPDPFDERDLEYRPRLEPLPPTLDQRHPEDKHFVLLQEGNSCTGHAVAAVINTVLVQMGRVAATNGHSGNGQHPAPQFERVSPYMLYRLARRYDEFEGEADIGSSLRGAFKGWFHHGVALEQLWPSLEMDEEPDLDDLDWTLTNCADRPLGAFYRVNAFRLDDMQSAINELNAIAVSAVIHQGWIEPRRITDPHTNKEIYLITRDVNSRVLGGHAFAFVGYNEVGFLVQNSWGDSWGKGGYATLPYEDWLDNAYDAWVARPGVPKTPFASGRALTTIATGQKLVTGVGPDLKRLSVHVVNLANNGKLSTNGKFISTPTQVNDIFNRMEQWHNQWLDTGVAERRHIVLYAHGGLVDETSGLTTAEQHVNWWLNNRIYPIYFAWQSGPGETLQNYLMDIVRQRLPFGGIGFDLMEQWDRTVEHAARARLRWVWEEMKENCRLASAPILNPEDISWPPLSSRAKQQMAEMPGASLAISRLANYIQKYGADNVTVHLVGHSAGSIFHAALVQRLHEANIRVETMSLLAAGLRVDEFLRDILPHMGRKKTVKKFINFALNNKREEEDSCPVGGITLYHKSLLFLVSRGFETGKHPSVYEVPLLGMERFFDSPLEDGQTLRAKIEKAGGTIIFSPSSTPADARSNAKQHGGFANDGPTMTSVVVKALGWKKPTVRNEYQPYAALMDGDLPSGGRPLAQRERLEMAEAHAPEPETPEIESGLMLAAVPLPPSQPTATHAPGSTPLLESAQPQEDQPTAPPTGEYHLLPEVAVAPRSGSPIVDVLESMGWVQAQP